MGRPACFQPGPAWRCRAVAAAYNRLRHRLPRSGMTETLLQAEKFNVVRLTCRMPDGRQADRTIVQHPGSVVILPLLDDGTVVLVRNYRPAVDGWLLELPAGTLEPPEPPADCAARELREETGYQAGSIEPLTGREREVLVLLAQGQSNREIAERLVLAKGTIKNHVSNILSKLQAENRTQAADIARRHGLI